MNSIDSDADSMKLRSASMKSAELRSVSMKSAEIKSATMKRGGFQGLTGNFRLKELAI